jgi:formate--tetrahydrofolate ligase
MFSSQEITRKTKKLHITKIAGKLKIHKKYLTVFGDHTAKIDLSILPVLPKPKAQYILVTAVTPTLLGEGKTVTTIGLSMALNKLGALSTVCLREPSLGPVFGIKGGGTGGGYSQVVPAEDINFHFTGDIHAVGMAHNLAAAFLDNALFKGNKPGIDPARIYWRRVLDINDRSLRNIRIGLGTPADGIPRDSGFDITASSEIMSIVALSADMADLRRRLSRMVMAETRDSRPVSADDIKVTGCMAAILKDAIKPNLVQTLENTPCFVHTGPFANIAHGSSSLIADRIALSLSDYVVTEAGFGADSGAEKFFDIKCRASGSLPDAAVVVCSVRALKIHSGRFAVKAGKRLPEDLHREDLEALKEGMGNLEKQIENVKMFGIPVVVCVNRFETDSDREIDLIREKSLAAGADDCQVSTVWKDGSKGGLDLARSVMRCAKKEKQFKFLYPLDRPIKEKIKTIACSMYGAADVSYTPETEEKIRLFTGRGWDALPICMAKTQLSLSHDPVLKGRPKDFILPVRDIRASIGAGFLSPVCGSIQTMPGLPSVPGGEMIDVDCEGNVIGLL